MKVLKVIDKLNVGGAERVAVDLAIMLKNEKLNIDFLCLLESSVLDNELIKNNVNIQYLLRKNKYSIISLFKLSKILRNYNIVHVHGRHVLRYICLASVVFRSNTYDIIFHDHYGKIDVDKRFSTYLKFCLKRCSAYIGVSGSLVDWARVNSLNSNIYLLENTVAKEKKFIELNTNSQIVAVGNIRPQKNYEFLIKLIAELPKDISIDVYGKVVDQGYFHKLYVLTQDLRIADRINFILDCDNTQSILKNYQIGLHCANSETGPLVAIEYMAQGIPFIMFNTGQVVQSLEGRLREQLIENFDLSTWKMVLLNLLTNEDLRDNISVMLREYYEENYSSKNYVAKCLKIYENIKSY